MRRLATIFFLCLAPTSVWAAPCAVIKAEPAPGSSVNVYDPFADFTPKTWSLILTTNNEPDCKSKGVAIRLDHADGNSGGSELPSIILKNTNNTITYYDSSESNPESFEIKTVVQGENSDLRIDYSLNMSSSKIPGKADEQKFKIKVYYAPIGDNGDIGVFSEVSENKAAVSLSVKGSVSSYFSGISDASARTRELDLGEIPSSGAASGDFKITVQANTDYNISLYTDFQGKLMRDDDQNSKWAIPYDVRLDGSNAPLDLSAAAESAALKISQSWDKADGQRAHRFNVSVPATNAANKRAGAYYDVITIMLSPSGM